jgi:hypothetical protein
MALLGSRPDTGQGKPREELRRARLAIAEIARSKRFHGFISFSGETDLRVATHLARALRRITARWPWQHPVRIFVDADCLGAGTMLTKKLEARWTIRPG